MSKLSTLVTDFDNAVLKQTEGKKKFDAAKDSLSKAEADLAVLEADVKLAEKNLQEEIQKGMSQLTSIGPTARVV